MIGMKLLSKIVWAEGMYLAPHHFQAQSRYFEESMHFATASLWNDAYGFADRQLNADALRNGTVALLHARGMFEDGLVFDMPECDPLPEPCKIADKFPPTADHLTVALAVPRWLADGQNCNLENTPDGTLAIPALLRCCMTKIPGATTSQFTWDARIFAWHLRATTLKIL